MYGLPIAGLSVQLVIQFEAANHNLSLKYSLRGEEGRNGVSSGRVEGKE